jgi:hypothetical protein
MAPSDPVELWICRSIFIIVLGYDPIKWLVPGLGIIPFLSGPGTWMLEYHLFGTDSNVFDGVLHVGIEVKKYLWE